MKLILISLISCAMFFAGCSNSGKGAKVFCDTVCNSDSLHFKGDHKLEPKVDLAIKNCSPDTVSWHHYLMDFSKSIHIPSFIGQDIRINPAAVSCVIKDTSLAWLTFNDCLTGRGFVLKLPFAKNGVIGKYTGALNSFDPKFSVDPDLRAYTDRGSIFVVNIKTGKEAVMSFGQAYDIDFNKIHEIVDTINVSRQKIFVRLVKEGKPVDLQKSIEL